MNKKDLDKLHKEIKREAMSSTRMVGGLLLAGMLTLISIFFLASCSAPEPLTAYEKHEVAYKEYLNKTNLMGTSDAMLQDMWRTVYMEVMIKQELEYQMWAKAQSREVR